MRICDLIKNQETYQAELGHTVLETVRAMVERNIGAVPESSPKEISCAASSPKAGIHAPLA